MKRTINVSDITKTVKGLCVKAAYELEEDVKARFRRPIPPRNPLSEGKSWAR